MQSSPIVVTVLQGGKGVCDIHVDEDTWSAINYVDYIEVDNHYRVPQDWHVSHGQSACDHMEALAIAYCG